MRRPRLDGPRATSLSSSRTSCCRSPAARGPGSTTVYRRRRAASASDLITGASTPIGVASATRTRQSPPRNPQKSRGIPYNDENSPEQPPSSLRELAQSDTASSTTSGEDAQSPRQDRARLRWREIKFPGRAAAAAHDDSTNAALRVETNATSRCADREIPSSRRHRRRASAPSSTSASP